MSAKDHAAVIQLFDLLESRYAMRVIWALSDGHPQTFRLPGLKLAANFPAFARPLTSPLTPSVPAE